MINLPVAHAELTISRTARLMVLFCPQPDFKKRGSGHTRLTLLKRDGFFYSVIISAPSIYCFLFVLLSFNFSIKLVI